MIFIILLGPLLVYSILKIFSIKFKLNYGEKTGKLLLGLIVIFFITCFFSEIIASKNIYLAGYRTPAIFITITCFLTSLYTLFRKENQLDINPLNFIVGFLCFTVGSLFVFEITGDYKRQLIYNDKKYRIENTSRGICEPCNYKIFIKNGVFDSAYDVNYPCYLNFKKIDINQANKNILKIKIYHDSESQLDPNPYEIEINI